MCLDRKVIIFGAGKNGENILKRLGSHNVACFCDNYKWGMEVCGKKVINFTELQNMGNDVVLSVNNNEIKKQLNTAGIPYWEARGMDNNFFLQKRISEALDTALFRKYQELEYYSEKPGRTSNWFRNIFCSDINKQLVFAMENDNSEAVSRILSDIYDKSIEEGTQELWDDEYYSNRPGMRLTLKLIREDDSEEKRKVCDLACGHGAFLREIKNDKIVCYGVDVSYERCQSLRGMGIECRLGSLEHSGYADEMFDYVTMMECLEHVQNPFVAVAEAYRILKLHGQIFVTVPFGTNCDSETHVRQFYESDLYTIARNCGFADIKIMRLPYINSSIDDNLFMVAKKQEVCI